jgi:hypothetical protein
MSKIYSQKWPDLEISVGLQYENVSNCISLIIFQLCWYEGK